MFPNFGGLAFASSEAEKNADIYLVVHQLASCRGRRGLGEEGAVPGLAELGLRRILGCSDADYP